MIFKEMKPKYEVLEIYIDKEDFGLMEVPQIVRFDFAVTMYADRKVLFEEAHDDTKRTEVLIENIEQFKKRKEFEL